MKNITSTATLCMLLFSAAGALALFHTNHANAKITGKVTDEKGNAVAGATVFLLTKQGINIGKGAQTDVHGKYEIKNLSAGDYKLRCAFIGYETSTKAVSLKHDSATISIHFQLHSSSAALQEVAVQSQSTRSNESSAKQLFCVISPAPATASGRVRVNGARHDATRHFVDGIKVDGNFDGELKDEDGFNTNDFNVIVENEFQRVNEKPLSTLSIDVDVASYSLVRSNLNSGKLPPKDAVRIEEMLNYFTYDYPKAKGDVPFSVYTEMSDCPWNTKRKLVHIGINGKEIEKQNLPPSNLVFLIDVSGSMWGPHRLGLVKQSLRMLVNELNEHDHIAMVVYAGASGLVLPSTSCRYKDKIIDAIEKLEAGGSTAGAAGIQLAYKVAKEHFLKDGNNRVILCTDGDFNVGVSSQAELIRLIEEKRESGVFLSVLGYGMGNYKDSKMEQLADKGNGNYAYIDNILEANKVLVKQMGATLHTIAKDVKIQVEFNPAHVKGYRLIGYENRLLADRDFNDDTKDAGEIGAGAGVTALYEIITDEKELEELSKVDKLKYQKTKEVEASNNKEWMTVKIRYKEPSGSVSKLLETPVTDKGIGFANTSENFKFAAAVASFGMLLRDSKHKGNFDFDKVIALAKASKGKDEDGYRAEFIRLAQTAQSIGITSKR